MSEETFVKVKKGSKKLTGFRTKTPKHPARKWKSKAQRKSNRNQGIYGLHG